MIMTTHKKIRKLGILGGIGPEASSYFYAEIIRRLRERGLIHQNADYPQIVLNSVNAPELVSNDVTDEMLEPYAQGILELVSLKPDYIVMACNTIHLFRDRLIKRSGYTNISNISEIVSETLKATSGSICVMGTASTVSSGLYYVAGRAYVNPDGDQLSEIGAIVVDYNATGEVKKNKEKLLKIIQRQKDKGAGIFIAGCTEVSELLHGVKSVELVDALELLIEDTIQRISTSA